MRNDGFPAQAGPDARVLILGSMPGQASLRAAQYYAHPRNAFWPIMCAIVGGKLAQMGPEGRYAERIELLNRSGIGLWDVMRSCVRPGSLDSAIDASSIVVNDFPAFFTNHSELRAIFFNGGKAFDTFRRQVSAVPAHLKLQQLPSTSPAHAAMSLSAKLDVWRQIEEYL